MKDQVPGWQAGVLKAARGFLQAIKVFVQFEYSLCVEPQPFPNGVTILHGRIERANACFISVKQSTADIHDEIFISQIELLQHDLG
jgi:hypothetical protein